MTDLVADFTERQRRAVLAVLCAGTLVIAWVFRYVQDDSFITFRYSRSFARGDGLVLNPGERVEGYTNFLWTWLMAIPERAGWSTPLFSILVGMALMVLTIVVAHSLARTVFADANLALLASVVLAANMTFVGYGVGGLETMMQTLLVTIVGLAVLRSMRGDRASWWRLGAGVAGGVACLTRMDSVVLVGTWFLIAAHHEWRRGPGSASTAVRVVRAAAELGLPVLAIVGPWLVWKYDYYGAIVPNTQAAKSGGVLIPFLYGVVYLLCFFASYLAMVFIGRFTKRRRDWMANPLARSATIVAGVWCLYICVVGGDFMEFRFMVPILPILAMAAAFLLDRFDNVRTQTALVVVLLGTSALHLVAPTVVPYPVLTFRELDHWPTESKTAWVGVGEYLAEAFPGGNTAPGQPRIAIQPLGVISYYSDLPVVDMLGLADADIAREGDRIALYYPGHVRMATVDQLLDKDVSLVIGLPTYLDADPDRRSLRYSELAGMYSTADLTALPESATVVEMPIVEGRVMLAIYLTPNAKVDALIEDGTWREIAIDPTCQDGDLNVLTRIFSRATCEGL